MHNINTSETINTRPPQGPCAGWVTNRSLQLLPVNNMLHSLVLKSPLKPLLPSVWWHALWFTVQDNDKNAFKSPWSLMCTDGRANYVLGPYKCLWQFNIWQKMQQVRRLSGTRQMFILTVHDCLLMDSDTEGKRYSDNKYISSWIPLLTIDYW